LTEKNVKRRMAIQLDDKVNSAPIIQEKIGGGRARITLGGYEGYQKLFQEAQDLVVVLRAGALPAPLKPITETTIGPALGHDSIAMGKWALIVGGLLVAVFMLIYYRSGGIAADIALIANLIFIIGILSGFGATLTLPGIAGIILTIGMAVDANVIIYERIREELRDGKSPRAAVDAGYKRAFWTIFDAQITTFIAGIVMLEYGTGAIKGFAVTLLIGIVTSMFSAIFISRILFDWMTRRRADHLSI
jgi:preprotein translocase subunit SecD